MVACLQAARRLTRWLALHPQDGSIGERVLVSGAVCIRGIDCVLHLAEEEADDGREMMMHTVVGWAIPRGPEHRQESRPLGTLAARW